MAEKSLDRLRTQLAAGEFEFSQHALRRMVERNIADEEIRQAGGHCGTGEVERCAGGCGSTSFNPRPAVRPGDATRPASFRGWSHVSIRARP